MNDLMDKKTILIDIDDTMGNLKEKLQTVYRDITSDSSISHKDWTMYNVDNRYGVTSEQLNEYFIEHNVLDNIDPHEDISYVTKELKALGFNIVVVTARKWHPNAYNMTKNWLDVNKVFYDDIILVGLTESKVEATKHIDNIFAFIDDRLDYCREFINSGRLMYSIVYAQAWNELSECDNNITGLHRIKNFSDILKFIRERI